MSPTPPVLLERDSEQGELGRALAAAAAGRGGIRVIEGPAGVGKTSLIRAAATAATIRGFRVLSATGSALETSFPFGGAQQLFGRGVGAGGRGTMPGEHHGAAATTPAYVASDRLYWLVSDLAETSPLLLAVDDLQWMDLSTLRFLHHLARRVAEHPVLLLLGHRPEPAATTEARAVIAALLAIAPAPVRPGALSPRAIARLAERGLGHPPDPAFVAACLEATGGNAFLVDQLLADLLPARATAQAVRAAAPDGVARRVASVLAALGEDAQALARAVAVLGETHLPVAAELAGLGPDVAAACAARLETGGIFAVDARPRFAHPLISNVVEQSWSAHARDDAHRRAARLLHDRAAPGDQVANHLLSTRPMADPWTVATLREAAAHASRRGAPEAALELLRRALAEPPAPDELAGTLLETGEVLLMLQQYADAVEVVHRARDLALGTARELPAVLALSQCHFHGARFEEAAAVLEEARPRARSAEELLVIDGNLLPLGLLDPARTEATHRLVAEYRRQAAEGTLEDPALLAILGATSVMAAEPREIGLDLLDRAVDERRLTAFGAHAYGFGWAIAGYQFASANQKAIRLLRTAVDQARRYGEAHMTAFLLSYLTTSLMNLGRLAEAEATGVQAADLLAGLGETHAYPFSLLDALIARGRAEEARTRLAEVPPGGAPQRHAVLTIMQGKVHAALGEPREALRAMLPAGAVLDDLGLIHPDLAPWREECALAAVRLGDRGLAERLAAELRETAHRTGNAVTIARAERTHGIVHSDEAALRFAVDSFETVDNRYELARALLALGEVQHHGGDVVDGRATLRRALDAAHAAGAFGTADLARKALVAAGGRPRRAALSGVDSLTAAELRIAQLAAGSLTNREIAEQLFVTTKTVESHLARVYAKLGAAGRRDLPGLISSAADSSA